MPSPEKFVLTQLAAEDLNEIWGYLALDNLEFADKVLSELESAMRNLSRSPGIGHFREDLADKRHKFFLVRSYLIVYQTETKPLRIIRVLHAARDVFSLLSSSE